jgi:hypothetical protein
MRFLALPAVLSALAACSSTPRDASVLSLHDPNWERVNVEIVVTKRADCDSRGEGYISSKQVVMRKTRAETIEVPNGATVCWRHDRDPNNPVEGAWSGWSRATVPPGQSADTDL